MDLSLYQKIVYIVLEPVWMITLYIFMCGVVKRKIKSNISVIGASLIYICVDIFIYFNFSQSKIFLLSSTILTILYMYIYSEELIKSIIMSFFWVLCGGVSEVISIYVTALFSENILEEVLHNNLTYAIICCITRLLMVVFSLVIYTIRKKDKSRKKTPIYWGVVAIVFFGSVFTLEIFYSISYTYMPSDENYNLLLIAVILMLINILIFYLYEEQAKHYAIKGDMEQLKNHMDKQRLIYENEKMIRDRESKERHDMKNLFIAMDKFMQEADYDKLSMMIKEKLGNLDSGSHNIDSGNKDIDVIMSYKIETAIKQGIQVSTEFDISSAINVTTEDLIILLGNAMDNAIEATQKTDNPFINIKIESIIGVCKIVITNAVNQKVKISDDMNIMTTKQGYGHGWGIKSIKNIVDKYNGKLRLDCDDKQFKLIISMFA